MNRNIFYSVFTWVLMESEVDVRSDKAVEPRYKFFHQRLPYLEAEEFCGARGYRMAKLTKDEIKNDPESSIYQFIKQQGGDCSWIGMNDRANEGEWRWSDGSPVLDGSVTWKRRSSWNLFFTRGSSDYGVLCFLENKFLWDHYRKSEEKSFICQLDDVRADTSVEYQYKFFHQRMTYSTAETYCENRGYRLAKLTKDQIKNDPENSIYQFVTQQGEDCTWIGMTDRDNEGHWRWLDGSVVVKGSVKWRKPDLFVAWGWKSVCDFGALCFMDDEILWDQYRNARQFPFICQHEIEKTTTTTTEDITTTTPEERGTYMETTTTAAITTTVTETTEGDSKQPLKKPTTTTVFRRVKSPARITTSSLMEAEFSEEITCLRLCSDRDECSAVNFNRVTKHCAIFGGQLADLDYVESPHWDIWTTR